MTPLQIVLPLLVIGFTVAAVIMCAETRRHLIRAKAAATRANAAAERAEWSAQHAEAAIEQGLADAATTPRTERGSAP